MPMPADEHKSRTWIEIVAGVFFALTLLAVGVDLESHGQVNSGPLSATAQVGLTYLLGSTWGYNFGLSIKQDEEAKGEFVLLASFFGTLIASLLGYAIYSIFFSGITDFFLPVSILIFSMVAFTAIMHTTVVDRRHLRKLLEITQNKASPVILTGYATASISDVYWGIGASLLAGLAVAVYPVIKKRLVELLESR